MKIIDDILHWVEDLIQSLTGRRKYLKTKIYEDRRSILCRAIRIARHDELAVRTWRIIPSYQREYDILITCDRLTRRSASTAWKHINSPNREQIFFRGSAFATHRFTVVNLYRTPLPNGRTRLACVFMADLDMQGMQINLGDRFAAIVADVSAKRLLIEHDDTINWLELLRSQLQRYIGPLHEV